MNHDEIREACGPYGAKPPQASRHARHLVKAAERVRCEKCGRKVGKTGRWSGVCVECNQLPDAPATGAIASSFPPDQQWRMDRYRARQLGIIGPNIVASTDRGCMCYACLTGQRKRDWRPS
jgi:hypothetical protein